MIKVETKNDRQIIKVEGKPEEISYELVAAIISVLRRFDGKDKFISSVLRLAIMGALNGETFEDEDDEV